MECQSYSYLYHLGTQATELTEAKESAYSHVRFSSQKNNQILEGELQMYLHCSK